MGNFFLLAEEFNIETYLELTDSKLQNVFKLYRHINMYP